ncbi:MAG: hypothetical protein IKG81_09365 [Bacteroidales bacterium]|nr:hypothetical protein [Bacteroidales bacterium]
MTITFKGTRLLIAALLIATTSACSGPQHNENEYWVDSVSPSNNSATRTTTTQNTTPVAKKTKPSIYVYVENSGSMYGYVGTGDGSDFRNMVYNYLTDIKLSDLFANMHLNFVNSSVIPKGSAVDVFVKNLNPTSFKVSGGNSGATDILEIIKRVYPKSGDVSVLISDCIISPGKGNNASEYLEAQQTGIKGFMGQKNLRNSGVIVYRMLGRFKGYYYDTVDNKQQYVGIRPYYVWVMGDMSALKGLRVVTEPKMKAKPDQICVISMGDAKPKYGIVRGGGNYKVVNYNTIQKVKKMKTMGGKRVVIKMNVDYSNILQDSAYLTNISYYQIDNPSFRIDNIIKMKNTDNYIITMSSPINMNGTLTVRLKNKPPQWVVKCSDCDGGFPDPNAKPQTTYGLAYLIGGAYDAYTDKGNNLAEMKINIK